MTKTNEGSGGAPAAAADGAKTATVTFIGAYAGVHTVPIGTEIGKIETGTPLNTLVLRKSNGHLVSPVKFVVDGDINIKTSNKTKVAPEKVTEDMTIATAHKATRG